MRACWGVLAGVIALGACTADKVSEPKVGTSGAFVAIVAWAVAEEGPPSSATGSMPVVYIAAESGKTIDAGVQAAVIKATVSDAKVRFADVSDDAIDANADGAPVKDSGVLLVLNPIDASTAGSRVDVPVHVYHAKTDQADWKLTLTASTKGVAVTSSTQPTPPSTPPLTQATAPSTA